MSIVFYRGLIAAYMLINIVGCKIGPDFVRPAPLKTDKLTTVTSSNSQVFLKNYKIDKSWWKSFASKELNNLMNIALTNNPDVKSAQAALKASEADFKSQQSILYPMLSANVTPTDVKTSEVLQSNLASNGYYYRLFTAQLVLSFIPDIWGGNRRGLEATAAMLEQKSFELRATYLTLTANIATTAIDLASLDEQIILQKELIQSQYKLLDVLQKRYQLGDDSQVDVSLFSAALANTEAELVPLEKQRQQMVHALATLTGRTPGEFAMNDLRLAAFKLPKILPKVLPIRLIEHRPDVRIAEAEMHAAAAKIGVAMANRLPNIQISSSNLGYSNTEISHWFNPSNSFWNAVGIVSQPVFMGGLLYYKQRAAEAWYQKAIHDYRKAVLHSFLEVSNVLTAIEQDAILLHKSDAALEAAHNNYHIALKRLELGDLSWFVLQSLLQNYYQAKIKLVMAQTNRLLDTVALYQAIGGSDKV
jgi:NodT family efflux transporter outer membrane factor (OMF) lipoprotein